MPLERTEMVFQNSFPLALDVNEAYALDLDIPTKRPPPLVMVQDNQTINVEESDGQLLSGCLVYCESSALDHAATDIVDKLFRLADQDCDGILTPDQAMEFLANLSNARPRSGIDKSNLEWLEQVFRQTVGNEKEIRRDDFKKIVISKNVGDSILSAT
ncbi:unnamed protein product [Timema podura]|uniref:EF-hand domain-containing protein n=1 Tax=Timema podura TaxID=61482 RepID=A0ABN7NZQ2_TIMPD|nr:unnamed protein product [Timema podura]